MNRIVLSGALALLLHCGNTSHAQDTSYHLVVEDDTLTSNVPLNDIKPRAFRLFARTYGAIAHSEWRKYPGGYLVRFYAIDSAQYHLYFNSNGRLYRTMIHYTAQNTPAELRNDVKSAYSNCSILYSSQLCEGENNVYNICLVAPDRSIWLVEMKNGNLRTIMTFDQ